MTEKTNGVDEAAMMHFIRQENSLRAQIAAIQAKRKNFRSEIKSFGVKLKNFDRIIEQFNAQDGGDEALEDLREQKRLAKLAGLPFGHQFTFFDEQPEEKATEQRGAYAAGRRAYLLGAKESENPFDVTQEQGQDWLTGYRDTESKVKEGKERVAAGPDAETEPKAAKGTLPDKSKKRTATNGKMASPGDDSEEPDEPEDAKPKTRKGRGLGPPRDDSPKATKPARGPSA